MDYFIKQPAFDFPNHEATTVADVLVGQFIARSGVPSEMHSREGVRVLSVSVVLKANRDPEDMQPVRWNGGRFNRTIVQELANYHVGQTEWGRKLPLLLMASFSFCRACNYYLNPCKADAWEGTETTHGCGDWTHSS